MLPIIETSQVTGFYMMGNNDHQWVKTWNPENYTDRLCMVYVQNIGFLWATLNYLEHVSGLIHSWLIIWHHFDVICVKSLIINL